VVLLKVVYNILLFLLIGIVSLIVILVFLEEPHDELFGYPIERTSCPTPACDDH
jgi:hypothetical protein